MLASASENHGVRAVPIQSKVLRVYETGSLTVIGFGTTEVVEPINIAECRDDILELVNQYGCKVLAFDFNNLSYIPSEMLGLLVSLTRMGIDVHLYNISADVRDVLEITRLEKLFTIQDQLPER
jgi:anti-sigma B factor antagonist